MYYQMNIGFRKCRDKNLGGHDWQPSWKNANKNIATKYVDIIQKYFLEILRLPKLQNSNYLFVLRSPVWPYIFLYLIIN